MVFNVLYQMTHTSTAEKAEPGNSSKDRLGREGRNADREIKDQMNYRREKTHGSQGN